MNIICHECSSTYNHEDYMLGSKKVNLYDRNSMIIDIRTEETSKCPYCYCKNKIFKTDNI